MLSTSVKTNQLECTSCGAPLKARLRDRLVTCQYCAAQVEIIGDQSSSPAGKVESLEKSTKKLEAELEVIRLQHELQELDRAWATRRQTAISSSPHDHPLKGVFTAAIILFVIASMVITRTAFLLSQMGALLVFGFILVGGVAWFLTSFFNEAKAEKRAHFMHHHRRRTLERMILRAQRQR